MSKKEIKTTEDLLKYELECLQTLHDDGIKMIAETGAEVSRKKNMDKESTNGKIVTIVTVGCYHFDTSEEAKEFLEDY